MAKKQPRPRCTATTAKGTQCPNQSWPSSDRCKTHDKDLLNRNTKEAKAASARANPLDQDNFHPNYMDIILWARELRKSESPPDNLGSLVQVGKLELDAITRAIEHQRLTDGLGAGVTHVFKVIYPEGEKPRPPTDDETVPERAVGDGEGKEKVMN